MATIKYVKKKLPGMNGSIWLICLCLFLCGCFVSSPVIEEEASPNWSPDSQSLVYGCYLNGPTGRIAESDQPYYTEADICTIDIQGRHRLRLTTDPGQDQRPMWSPDGSQIVYVRDDGLYLINADGSHQRRFMATSPEIGQMSWSPQGTHLLFSARLGTPNDDIFLIDVRDGHSVNLTQDTASRDMTPMWAFDGTKIVYLSADVPWYELTPMRLKAMNADGSDQQIIDDKAIFYNFVSVTQAGQMIFTTFDLTQDGLEYVYTMNFDEQEPIRRSEGGRWQGYAASPNRKYFSYQDTTNLKWQILEIETGQVTALPESSEIGYIESVTWSPDSQYVALTIARNPSGFYEEHHIAIYDVQQNLIYPLDQR